MNLDMMPLPDRPAFARKLLAVWRLQHLAAGEDVTISVAPGEWPDAPRQVKGVPVVDDDRNAPGAVMVLGRVGTAWRVAYNHALALATGMTVEQLTCLTGFAEVDDDREMKVWAAPSPDAGRVPVWSATRGA